MFTTQHYQAIAEILKSHQTDPDHCANCDRDSERLTLLAYDFACMFEQDNPRFKADHFYTAAGFAKNGTAVTH